MTHECTKCGKTENCHYNDETIAALVDRQLCFSCDWYWRYLHSPVKEEHRHHHSTAIVVNGSIYTDGGNLDKPHPNGWGVGHGGSKFHIRMLDGSREFVTNNLWSGGTIDALWRAEIPDTAEFVRLTHTAPVGA